MDTPVQPNISSAQEAEANGGYRFALISLTTLFFMWGFITCLNDILIPYLKGAFNLSFTQAMLIQFCFLVPISLCHCLQAWWCRALVTRKVLYLGSL